MVIVLDLCNYKDIFLLQKNNAQCPGDRLLGVQGTR